MCRLSGTVLVLNVLAQDRTYWRRAEIGARPTDLAKWDLGGWREGCQQLSVLGDPRELRQVAAEVRAHVPHDLVHIVRVGGGRNLVPVVGG